MVPNQIANIAQTCGCATATIVTTSACCVWQIFGNPYIWIAKIQVQNLMDLGALILSRDRNWSYFESTKIFGTGNSCS